SGGQGPRACEQPARFPILRELPKRLDTPGTTWGVPTATVDPVAAQQLAVAVTGLAEADLARLRLTPTRGACKEGALSVTIAGPEGYEITLFAKARDEDAPAFVRTGGLNLWYRASTELALNGQLALRAARHLRQTPFEALEATWREVTTASLRDAPAAELDTLFGDARFAKSFGDNACGMMGALDLLSDLQGDFAVIVHGDRPCLMRGQVGQSKFYTSDLKDVDVVTGGGKRLMQATDYVMGDTQPKAIALVSTCLSQMIGEDIDALADEIEERHGLPCVAMRVSGIELLKPFEVSDRVHGNLARRFVEPLETREDEISFVGYANESTRFRRELDEVLGKVGLKVGVFWPDDTLEQLPKIGASAVVMAPERTGFKRFLSIVGRKTEARVVEQVSPVGLAACAAFYRRLGEETGRWAELEPLLAPRAERAEARIARFRERFAGARVAVCFGNNRKGVIHPSFVHLGLGYVPFLRELGLEPVFMVVSDETAEQYARVRALARNLDAAEDIYLYQRPERLPALLHEAGGIRAAFTEDCHKHYVDAAGVPYLQFRAFHLGYASIIPAIDTLEALLR
ncbi:MAG: hypothetical protein EP329_19035, partial [Deltaproteobacteria bacterium]